MKIYYSFRLAKTTLVLLLAGIFIISGCTKFKTDPAYISEIELWQQLRIDSLKGHTGYLNLAGLFWFSNDVNSIGADSSNTFIFPKKAADNLGQLIIRVDSVWFVPAENGLVKINGAEPTEDSTLVFVEGAVELSMGSGDLNWFIIKRGNQYGIRLKDFNHPLLASFNYIDNFPIHGKWKVKATWEEYAAPKVVTVHNQVGMDLLQPVSGALHFELAGNDYVLEPLGLADVDEYFVMLYDKTSGHETYGSGRYLYVPRADSNGTTYIDFNKAYNPPCAFTEFATCLFPHEANRLPVRIEAGEKYAVTLK